MKLPLTVLGSLKIKVWLELVAAVDAGTSSAPWFSFVSGATALKITQLTDEELSTTRTSTVFNSCKFASKFVFHSCTKAPTDTTLTHSCSLFGQSCIDGIKRELVCTCPQVGKKRLRSLGDQGPLTMVFTSVAMFTWVQCGWYCKFTNRSNKAGAYLMRVDTVSGMLIALWDLVRCIFRMIKIIHEASARLYLVGYLNLTSSQFVWLMAIINIMALAAVYLIPRWIPVAPLFT